MGSFAQWQGEENSFPHARTPFRIQCDHSWGYAMTPGVDSDDLISPIVAELVELFRRQIYDGGRPGERLPTETELAEKHGRAVKTIRKALSVLADEGLVVRRQGSGTYISRNIPERPGTSGLIFFSDASQLMMAPYAREALRGLMTEMTVPRRHLHPLLGYQETPRAIHADFARRLDISHIDSIITLEVFDQNTLAMLAKARPVVAIDLICYARGVSSVAIDHAQTMRLAVDHLVRLGHRRIGLMGNMSASHTDPAVRERMHGFRDALGEHGLAFDRGWVTPVSFHSGMENGFEKWRRSGKSDRPTAFVCVDLQWPVVEAAMSEGLRVPGDLSLVGIGELDPWPAWVRNCKRRGGPVGKELLALLDRTDTMDPSLTPLRSMEFTSIDLPFFQMGRWAMQETMRRLRNMDSEPEHKLCEGTLIPGNTAAPPS